MVVQMETGEKSQVAPHRQGRWLAAGTLSGFVATIAFSGVIAVAYLFASSIGVENGNTLERWLWALANNPLTNRTENQIFLAIALNIVVGLVLGIAYARVFEPMAPGAGWFKGAVFALFPFALSVLVFFPVMGVGLLGLDIDAGPLPLLGNLIAHLVYGATLGSVFGISFESWLDDTDDERQASARSERGAVTGLVAGLPVGAIVGFLVSGSLSDLGSQNAIILAGALVGGAVGLLIGSLMGIGDNVAGPNVEGS